MGRLFGVGFILVVLAAACAPPAVEDGVKPRTVKKSGDDDDATTSTAGDELDETPAPPVISNPIDAGGATATTYIGTLDATQTVRFGGKTATQNFCDYDVTLKNVVIEVTALPSGEVIGANVTDTMVEASVPPCTFSPAPPSAQTFAFTTMTGSTLGFVGGAANQPKTSLTIELVKAGASYEAAATWHRTDQTAPLDWIVKTKITLGPR